MGWSETEAWTLWADGKPWEMASGELRWEGARRKVTEAWTSWTVKPWEIAWGEFQGCWHGFFRTNFINTIVPKKCAPKTCQSFQAHGHGTCIASVAGSETKRVELLARVFEDKFIIQIPSTRLSRKTVRSRLVKWSLNAGQRDMHGKKFVAGDIFNFARRSVVFAPFAAKQTK